MLKTKIALLKAVGHLETFFDAFLIPPVLTKPLRCKIARFIHCRVRLSHFEQRAKLLSSSKVDAPILPKLSSEMDKKVGNWFLQ